jgi:hypothetical protein
MKTLIITIFLLFQISAFSQRVAGYNYQFTIESISSYVQAKPYYDQIRVLFNEERSVNYPMKFDDNNHFFTVFSTIAYDRQSLSIELERIGLMLNIFNIDTIIEE